MNTIEWSKKAKKQLLKISRQQAKVIFDKVEHLKLLPGCNNVKPLKKHKYGYRLRVGNYRVLFDHEIVIKIVRIEEVKKRDENTY